MQFPTISGTDLARTTHTFPASFGRPTLACIAFDIKGRDELETWLPFLDARRAEATGAWLFPVLPAPAKMMRGAVESMLRKVVTDDAARALTVPLFVDVDAFAAALGIADRTHIVVLLLAADGTVLEHVSGAYGEAAGTALQTRLRDLA